MDDISFLEPYRDGRATIIIRSPQGECTTLTNLNTTQIENRCALLAFSLIANHPERPHFCLEDCSKEVGISFLRYIYTGGIHYQTIITPEAQLFDLSVLAHLHLLGTNFDMPDLVGLSLSALMREIELSCSLPVSPKGLCAGIRFVYDNLPVQQILVDSILHYCLNCMVQHRLNQTSEFQDLVYNHEGFHRDLLRVNGERNFADAGAAELIRLPGQPVQPAIFRGRDNLLSPPFYDFLFDCMGDNGNEEQEQPMGDGFKHVGGPQHFTLVQRPKVPDVPMDENAGDSSSSDNESEVDMPSNPFTYLEKDVEIQISETTHTDNEFLLVHRPFPNHNPFPSASPYSELPQRQPEGQDDEWEEFVRQAHADFGVEYDPVADRLNAQGDPELDDWDMMVSEPTSPSLNPFTDPELVII